MDLTSLMIRKCDEARKKLSQSSSVPQVGYHITDAETAIKIIDNSCLWMSDLMAMNDPQEIIHGATLVRDAVQKRRKGAGNTCVDYVALATLAEVMDMCTKGVVGLHCASLTSGFDEVGPWMMYGNSGLGVAIGLSLDALIDGATESSNGLELWLSDIIYEASAKEGLALEYVELTLKVYNDLKSAGTIGDLDRSAISNALSDLGWAALSRMKQAAFAGEKEWRILCNPKVESLSVPDGRRHPVYELQFEAERAIVEVVVGPSEDRGLTKRSWEARLRDRKLRVPVREAGFEIRTKREAASP